MGTSIRRAARYLSLFEGLAAGHLASAGKVNVIASVSVAYGCCQTLGVSWRKRAARAFQNPLLLAGRAATICGASRIWNNWTELAGSL